MSALIQPLTALASKSRRKLPLPLLLVVPFALQVFAVVGLVGYISFKNGQQAVNNLAHQLMDKSSEEASGQLNSYLRLPQQLAQVNREAIASGQLNFNAQEANEQYFWRQAKAFPNLSYIGYTLTDGREAGAGRWLDGKTLLVYENLSGAGQAFDYVANNMGNRAKLLQRYDYDPWVLLPDINAVKAGKPIWDKIYTFEVGTIANLQVTDAGKMLQSTDPSVSIGYGNYLALPARSPIYDQKGKLIGMVAIDLLISQISDFLRAIKVSPSGQIFIIERDGQLVGSSSRYPVTQKVDQEVKRLSAIESSDPLIRRIAQALKEKFGTFQNIEGKQQLDVRFDAQQQFIHVTPWKDAYGLDWLVVVTVPESDFMTQINANNRTTIWLCLGALGLATVLGFFTSRRIAQPILKLGQVSESLSMASQLGFESEQLNQQVEATGIYELDKVGRSFNRMAGQLQRSFRELEQTNADLEHRVEARTAELSKTLVDLRSAQAHMVQSEKMSALGQMVAGVAHEINNPVNFIHGNLIHVNSYTADLLKLMQLYQKYYPDPPDEIRDELVEIDLSFLEEDLTKVLRSMRVGTDRIREIVLSLRNFSRLDESDFKSVDIHEGIDNTLTILQNRLKSKPHCPGIEVIRHYGNLPSVECYPGQLNQVFMNILNNAIDALDDLENSSAMSSIEKSQKTIEILTYVTPNESVIIQISDNAAGMSEAVRSHIFDPFFTTKPVGKGTGLGLSISYQVIVEKHKGRLSCESALGTGTKFVIEIPVREIV